MAFWQLLPRGPLARHVERLWASRREALPHGLEWLLPSGRADLVIPLHDEAVLRVVKGRVLRLRGGVFQGASDAPVLRATGGAADVVGVQFRPGGAAALLGGAAGETGEAGDGGVALADFPGGWAALRERLGAEPEPLRRLALLAAALEGRARAAEPDRLVATVLAALHASPELPRIESLRSLAGLGATRFTARFHAAVGLTPKRYARLLRFNRALEVLAAPAPAPLAELALRCGYADQAHFTNEFRRLAGVPPSRYEAAAADAPHHRPERKNLQDAAGAAGQTGAPIRARIP